MIYYYGRTNGWTTPLWNEYPTQELGSTPTPTSTPTTTPTPTPTATPIPSPETTPSPTPTPTTTLSPDEQVEAFVTRIYQNVFGRDPHPQHDNPAFWVEGLTSGIENVTGIIYGFFFSTEFLNNDVSNDEFITIAYKTFLDRDPDPNGMAHWQHTLTAGYNRRYVIEQMITDEEFTRIVTEYGMEVGPVKGVDGFVSRMYRIVLDRKYDQEGFDHWKHALQSKIQTAADIVDGFFNGLEFENRNTTNEQFIEIAYNTFLNRDPEESGMTFWLGLLNSGVNRKIVLKEMIEEEEFGLLCDEYGIEVGVMILE